MLELLNEVRVALPGVQILFAFLLTLPFTARFDTVRPFDRGVYAATLVSSAVASILFISVAAEHRLRWRRGEKADIVERSRLIRRSSGVSAPQALGMTGAILVVLRTVLGDAVGTAIAVGVFGAFGWFWFGLPLTRRRAAPAESDRPHG